jgi:hypothetical protein
MTFTLTLISQHGIWQSSDQRLTDPKTNRVEDDYSSKHVGFRCPDGAALLTYAGVGRAFGVHISDWIREFTRGESQSVDQTLIQIRQRATEDLGEECPLVSGSRRALSAAMTKRPRSPGDPMTLGNMRANRPRRSRLSAVSITSAEVGRQAKRWTRNSAGSKTTNSGDLNPY